MKYSTRHVSFSIDDLDDSQFSVHLPGDAKLVRLIAQGSVLNAWFLCSDVGAYKEFTFLVCNAVDKIIANGIMTPYMDVNDEISEGGGAGILLKYLELLALGSSLYHVLQVVQE